MNVSPSLHVPSEVPSTPQRSFQAGVSSPLSVDDRSSSPFSDSFAASPPPKSADRRHTPGDPPLQSPPSTSQIKSPSTSSTRSSLFNSPSSDQNREEVTSRGSSMFDSPSPERPISRGSSLFKSPSPSQSDARSRGSSLFRSPPAANRENSPVR